MRYTFDYKDERSKLVRFDAEIIKDKDNNGMIKKVMITGDFFATPESIISLFESYLKNKPVCFGSKKVESDLVKIVKEKNATLIGIRPDIIVKALAYFCERFKKDGA